MIDNQCSNHIQTIIDDQKQHIPELEMTVGYGCEGHQDFVKDTGYRVQHTGKEQQKYMDGRDILVILFFYLFVGFGF